MSDKWRFDPNEDYTSDEYENGGKNFQRFTNRRKGHKGNISDDETHGKKKQSHHSPHRR